MPEGSTGLAELIGLVSEKNQSPLCVVCHARPRGARGALQRCLQCIRDAAAVDRATRQAIEARLAAELATKACRT